jgi:hypothetical protein
MNDINPNVTIIQFKYLDEDEYKKLMEAISGKMYTVVEIEELVLPNGITLSKGKYFFNQFLNTYNRSHIANTTDVEIGYIKYD